MTKSNNKFEFSISDADILSRFDIDCNIPNYFYEYYSKIDTSWRYPTEKEKEAYIHLILQRMLYSRKSLDRQVNYEAFNNGWLENLNKVSKNGITLENIKPGYYRGVSYLLYDNNLIIPKNPQLNYDLAILSAIAIFSKYLSQASNIYEFGCGSGLNVFILHKLFPDKQIIGLDWCENAVEIINRMNAHLSNKIRGERFDMLAPDESLPVESESMFLTYTSMEQIGVNFKAFFDFMQQKSPQRIIHWEPFVEAYDDDNFWQLLSHNYCQARGYLNGLYSYISDICLTGKIKILNDSCPGFGGEYYLHNLLVWEKVLTN